MVLAACAPLAIAFYNIPIYTPYLPFLAVVVLALFMWLLRSRRLIRRREEFAFVSAQALIVLTSVASVDPNEAISASIVAIYAAGIFLIVRYFLTIQLLKKTDLLVWSAIIFALLTVVALLQFILQSNIGIVSTYFGKNFAEGTYADEALRISSTFGNANVFSQVYTIYGTILVSSCLFYFRWLRLALLLSCLIIFVVAISLSRSGIIFTLFLQIAIYLYWVMSSRRRRGERMAVVGIIVVCASAILGISSLYITDDLIPGASRFADFSDSGRLETYFGAMQLLQDPFVALFGVGSGQFFEGSAIHGIYYGYKVWLQPYELKSTVHNWFLQIATENGVVVLFLYVYAIFKTARRGWSIRKLSDGWLAASLAITMLSLYMTALQFGTTGTTPWILTPIAIILAWIQNEYDKSKKRNLA
ncbi:O-antigen ligase family protein [Nitrosococcus wardiae]|nr:O-antigen ligase family protein [Nitrosococcus wardiae]